MVESAEMRDGDDCTLTVIDLALRGRVAIERQVRARLVVVADVAQEDAEEMQFAQVSRGKSGTADEAWGLRITRLPVRWHKRDMR